MKSLQNKKGFTLIELLVVITIIGILATGATATYTSQIQKARDTTRINDAKALESGLEQTYQDKGVYPNAGSGTSNGDLPSFLEIKKYTPKLPSDPKTGQKSSNSNFDYIYAVGADKNSIVGQIYEISIHFENKGNIDEKAAKDGGNDVYRQEFGISLDTLITTFNFSPAIASWINKTAIGNACIASVAQSATSTSAAGTQNTGTAGACPIASSDAATGINAKVLIIR